MDGLRRLRDSALAMGLPQDNLWLDPGIGFGKNGDENFLLLRSLRTFHDLGCALIVGPSRKRFLASSAAEPAADRDFATAAAVAAAVAAGCQIIRVHNVAAMAHVVRAAERIWPC
jgi:dihydropteroate synthase